MARRTARCSAWLLAAVAYLALFSSAAVADNKNEDEDALVDECRVNLCIAIDQGGSTTEEEYKQEKESILRLVDNLKDSDGNQFLSLIGYSDTAKPIAGPSLEEALNATTTLAKDGLETSGTNIGDAIMKCTENMNTIPAKHRRKLQKVIVVLTDDNPSMPISRDVATAYSVLASYAATAENITVMTVGVGDKVNTTLLQLFSTAGPNDAPLTFTADDWTFGGSDDFVQPMLEAVCRKGDDGQAFKGQVDKPGDLTTLMISVLNGYNEAQDKTDMLLSYPEVVDNIKQVARRAQNTTITSDVTYLDVVYRQGDRPEADWLKSSGSSAALDGMGSEGGSARKCQNKPVCRIYMENMACCQDQGVVSGAKGSASFMVMCSETVVGLPPTCLQVDGPDGSEVTFSYGQKLRNNSPGVALHFDVAWEESEYVGDVVLDANATSGGNCQLQLADPCEFDGKLYTSVPDIQPITFNVVSGGAKRMVELLPDDVDMRVLTDSLVWSIDNDQCQNQLNSKLPDDFDSSGWVAYRGGNSLQCRDINAEQTAGRR